MDYQTFKVYVRRAGLGIKEFAHLAGMNYKSISNYSKRDKVPSHLVLLVLMMVELVQRDVDLNQVLTKLEKGFIGHGGERR
jgi:archaellum biogenesis protein FlaJ (TadC family)